MPTLVLDDGRALGESNAIIWYFAEGTPYLPDDRFERAQVLQWLFFEQYDHEPNIAVVRFWVARRDHAADEPRSRRAARRHRGAATRWSATWREPRFLVGERYTIADIALYAYTHVAPEGGFDLEPYPAITRMAGARRRPARPHRDHRLTVASSAFAAIASRK